MSKILVSGLINIETTLKINSFPIEYNPVNYPYFGIESTVSGVGYNVAKALKSLGNNVNFVSIVGEDINGKSSIQTIKNCGIGTDYIETKIKETAQSVILYDDKGVRQINVDLKDLQHTDYSKEKFDRALDEVTVAVLCNINFSRPFLKQTKEMGKIVATDVHVLSDVHDEYNKDFLQYSDIVFLSNENILGREKAFIEEIYSIYKNKIIICGLGRAGALMHLQNEGFFHYDAVDTRPIVNTIGAGDALFSAFIHCYAEGENPHQALKKAIVFASWKIGEKGAASGFLTEAALESLCHKVYSSD